MAIHGYQCTSGLNQILEKKALREYEDNEIEGGGQKMEFGVNIPNEFKTDSRKEALPAIQCEFDTNKAISISWVYPSYTLSV